MDEKKINLAQLPTPDQLPPPVDLSQLPPQIVSSEPVDKILRHNDDLMARLSVNLRRVSFLEDKVENLQKNNKGLAKHYHSLKDQLLIVQERSKNLNFRYKKRDTSLQQLETKLQQAESLYTQLQNSSQKTTARLQQQNTRLLKYKQRLRHLARQALKQNKTLEGEKKILQESLLELEHQHQYSLQSIKQMQKQQSADNQAHSLEQRQLQKENTQLKTQLQNLELTKKENINLKERLHETNTKHQLLKNKTIKEVANANNIVTHYKSKIDIYKYECERLQNLLELQKKPPAPPEGSPDSPPQDPQYDILNSEKLQLALQQIRDKIKNLSDDE